MMLIRAVTDIMVLIALFIQGAFALWAISLAVRCAVHYWRSK